MAIPDPGIVSDGYVEDLASREAADWNQAEQTFIHLAVDQPFEPATEDSPSSFDEAAYSNYEALDMEDKWTHEQRQPGAWSITSDEFEFQSDDPDPVTITGVYVSKAGNLLIAAKPLPVPVQVSSAHAPLRRRVRITFWAGQVFAMELLEV